MRIESVPLVTSRRTRTSGLVLLALVAAAGRVMAQPVPPAPPAPPDPPDVEVRDVVIVHGGPGDALGGPFETGFMPAVDITGDVVAGMPLGVGGERVEGAPYSAEAVTEVVQTLADGNRIVRQSRSAVYRDGLGRTRREQGIALLGGAVAGAPATSGKAPVQVHDPRTGTMYLLDLDARTAQRLPSPKVRITRTDASGTTTKTLSTFDLPVPPPPPPPPLPPDPPVAGGSASAPHNMIYMRRTMQGGPGGPGRLPEGRVEPLGTRTIEGVSAEGTRSTTTIPAGQIGNERPIEIVSERWYSPALKVLVMSRRVDPRFGETTYRLTGITQAEPPPDLFEVPADFTVIEGRAGLRIEKRIERRSK